MMRIAVRPELLRGGRVRAGLDDVEELIGRFPKIVALGEEQRAA